MKKIAIFLSIVVAAIACEQVDPVTPPEVDFANPDVVIPYQGSEDESLKLEFSVNVDWTAELDQAYNWLSLAGATSGKAGDASITVVASPNTEVEPRTAVIKVTAGVSVLVFNVFQEGYPALSVEPTELSFEADGGNATIAVSTNVEYVISQSDKSEWITYKEDKAAGSVTFTIAPNDAFAPRTATVTLSNNVDGVSQSISVSQTGRATVLWEKSLSEYTGITLGAPLHIAYLDGNIALSTGSAIYTIKPDDGSFIAPVAVPEGFVVASMTNDDAGNLVIANNIAFGASGDVYAITGADNLTPVKVATLNHNAVYSATAGNLRAGGDVTSNGVVTMIVDVTAQYWIGCDIVDGAAAETQFGILDQAVFDGGTLWNVQNGCVAPLGSKLADGLLATYYPSSGLYSNESGSWATVGGSDWYKGNDNNCAISEATYDGVHFAAVAIGSHFNYSATGFDLFDLTSNKWVYTYSAPSGELVNSLSPVADVVLVPTEDALYIYYADLQKATIACVEVK